MDKLYIIIPAYNESQNIANVIEEWYPVVEKHSGQGARLVVIDDGSKDDTYRILCEYGKEKPLLVALTKENSGHGATVLYGYQYALEQGADYIFQTDSDGQTVASEFDAFWQLRDDYDMVIGHRQGREDGVSRVLVTKILKWVISFCFHVNVTDANTPFRLINGQTLKKYIHLIPEGFNLSNVILAVIFEKNCKTKYMRITFRPRQGGKNSINMKRIIKIGMRAIKDFITIEKMLEGYENAGK